MKKIVLTGGPCGGKTTILSRAKERLESLGYRTFVVPEAATLLFKAGLSLSDLKEHEWPKTQQAMLETVLALEDSFEKIAKSSGNKEKTVILYDRGALDVKAFCTKEAWKEVLGEKTEGMLLNRYDAVIHLVSAAIGAESHYNLESNSTRTETIEEAAKLDIRLTDAWTGHPKLFIVSNLGDFNKKINDGLTAICETIGIPEPIESERKFIVELNEDIPVHHVVASIRQDYLRNPGSRVRKWESKGHKTYTRTQKIPRGHGTNVEIEEKITEKEYINTILNEQSHEHAIILKNRHYFIWNNQYMELDDFITRPTYFQKDTFLLEVEVSDMNQYIDFPPFIELVKEVTGEMEYSNSHISLTLHKENKHG